MLINVPSRRRRVHRHHDCHRRDCRYTRRLNGSKIRGCYNCGNPIRC